MALDLKPGKTLTVTVNKHITREAARKTLERLFMQDKAVVKPIDIRSANFKELPKRRGGQIWTKRPNKVHPSLAQGAKATIKATPQTIRDLNSVASFVEVKSA
jgi:ribosomal protein L23